MATSGITALAAALLLSTSLAACGDKTPKASDATVTTPDGSVASAAATPDNATVEYVEKAAIGDMFEVESSKLALERSKVAEVKAFAQEMIDAHTATTNEVKPLAAAISINPPAAMDDKHAGMMEDLRKASVQDFDDRYIDMQTAAHKDGLDLHRKYAENGTDPGLKAFAASVWPKVQQHLDHVKLLDKSPADDVTKAPS